MMQGFHQQQQQLAALLTAALPKDDSSRASAPTSSAASASLPPEEDEKSRLSAMASLHRTIIYPSNAVVVSHSASFLAQGFSQLVTDKLFSVRHAAARAYGALCSVLCLLLLAPNGRQNHGMLGSLVDGFIGWSLPSLRNISNGISELALVSLHEFLGIGEGAVERYALPILKACQELLEDEMMSLSLMPRILGVLTLISLKFFRCFQPHFKDIVDILLGWALIPDSTESDKDAIMDSFLQFQKHWVNNLQFSLGLLSKFLDDMDLLLHDGSGGSAQQFKRLLSLLSCFCTVLQSVASGLLEINFLERIKEPLTQILPALLRCLSMIGTNFGWLEWIEQSWRCLTLLAEILMERFSSFYPDAVDILFQSLDKETKVPDHNSKVSSFQVHGILKTNLQLLSLQKLGLMPSSVLKLLQFNAPISQLRLHPNHLVTGSAAATYIFLLQHKRTDVVAEVMSHLFEELQMLKFELQKISGEGHDLEKMTTSNTYSKNEVVYLISFDVKVLLSTVDLQGIGKCTMQINGAALCAVNAEKLLTYLTENLDLFEWPMDSSLKLKVDLIKTVERLSTIDFMFKRSTRIPNSLVNSLATLSEPSANEDLSNQCAAMVSDHLRKYTSFLVRALDISSPLSIKIEALLWLHKFCEDVIDTYKSINAPFYPWQHVAGWDFSSDLLFSTLIVGSDREPKVRALVTTVLPMLLKAKLVHPVHFPHVAQTILEKHGDPETDIESAYLNLIVEVCPLTVYMYGLSNCVTFNTSWPQLAGADNRSHFRWKEIIAFKQLPQRIHAQQFVSVLSYISQRWKVPLSSWIQRLVHSCQSKKQILSSQPEEAEASDAIALLSDIEVEEGFLERVCSVNHLHGAWWATHEAARFCVTTRLRTHLGGPTQTFAALERMLLDISQVLQLETDQIDGALTLTGSNAHLLPMRLLIEFVEALKKNVYNAYEGSALLPHVSRTSSSFFRANKKVCEEWFSRIAEPMMEAGLVLQCSHATIHHSVHRLLDIVSSALSEKSRVMAHENLLNIEARYSSDILKIIRNLALALCRINEPEALVGLQKWATQVFSPLPASENQGASDNKNWGQFSLIHGLVYQADGQYEKAAAYFSHLLQTEESLSSMGSDGIQFAIARIIESYTAIFDWKSLESWLLELQALRLRYVGKSFSGALTTAGNELNSVQALARFDEGDFKSARLYLDLTPKSSNELTLDPRLALQRSEQMLLQAMLLQSEGKIDEMPHELQKAKVMLEEAFSVLPFDGLVEAAPYANQLYCISAFDEGCRLGSISEPFPSILDHYIQTIKFPFCDQVHQDCSMWLKVFRIHQNRVPDSPVTLELCKNLVSLARKQRNLMLASRLNSYLKGHASVCSDESLHNYFVLCGEYENALLLHAENKLDAAFKSLWAFVRPDMLSSSIPPDKLLENALKAKACTKLSNWLQEGFEGKHLESIVLEMQEELKKKDIPSSGKEDVISANVNQGFHSGLRATIEELVGTAMKASTRLCPAMGKSWILYASWCYTQATASMSPNSCTPLNSSFSPILVPEIHSLRYCLNEVEKSRIRDIVLHFIPEICDGTEIQKESGNDIIYGNEGNYGGDKLKLLLQQLVNAIETAAGVPREDEFRSNSLMAKLLLELKGYLVASGSTLSETEAASLVTDLVDVYQSLRQRRVSMFGEAAQAFINFLSCSYSKNFYDQLTGCHLKSKFRHASYTLKSTLYLLRIMVNYGAELKETLETSLSKVPLLPWQEITPQLFARLSSHPETMVRKQLETLLLMLAKSSPWSLIYPTLLDANSPNKEPSEEIRKILACLNRVHPNLVQDAQLMIMELENVTVLWEELWLGTLQDLHADVIRRINLLKEEAVRIAENATLSQEEKNKINAAKYTAMMAPIVVVLERRLASTSQRPKTPHELRFLEEYKEKIDSAIMKFKIPPHSVAALGDIWRPFESITISLASHQRKSSTSLGEVAPQLASLVSSSAPMPGLEKQVMIFKSEKGFDNLDQGVVTIASFFEQVKILPTKTKPKKLAIVGSDGQKYTYLLKGREDLRLDARIMQLLQSVYGFLQSSLVARRQSLPIRTYSVTPISGKAGLIQWVDNSISIYSVFKSWQQRAQLHQLGRDTNVSVTPVPRPSDMFYGKIIPALKEMGIRRVVSRRDWPHVVKRKVLLDLMNETPKQLLYQELWCASEGFKSFSSKLRSFSGSVAVMSMLGHILGLGDRHLDNILVDFFSGEVVHIDYNVCFDKGQRLKIPEVVPFRLTQTIEAALGITSIEGSFRSDCETVISSLRENKDIILMLLEVFVWDPLVEWTRSNVHDNAAVVGEERKGMELAVSLSLFASRAQEIRVPLQEHHDLLLSTIPEVELALERFFSILNQYETVASHFYHADQERINFIQYEKSAKSVVAEAASNLEQSSILFDIQLQEFTQAQALVRVKGQEASAWIEQHRRILNALKNSSTAEVKALVKLAGSEEALSLVSSVVEARVPWTVVPEPTQILCHDIDQEVSRSTSELAHWLSSAVTTLQVYSFALQQILPSNYISTSPLHGWAQILLSLDDISSDSISICRKQCIELVNSGNSDRLISHKSNYDSICFRLAKCSDDIVRMKEEHSVLEMSIGSETESGATERLVSDFVNYMQLAGLKQQGESGSSGPMVHKAAMNSDVQTEIEDHQLLILTMLDLAVINFLSDIKQRTKKSLVHFGKEKDGITLQSALESFFIEFEEQIEKCELVTDLVDKLMRHVGLDISDSDADATISNESLHNSWVSIFKTSITLSKNLIGNLLDVTVPMLIKFVISSKFDFTDIFGSISQIRGSIETVLDQLIQVVLERGSLIDLESNYSVKVDLMTEQQLALEEAAVKGRDHLSWEEAEELASQEEACRVQLDRLHHIWNQKDIQTSSLEKKETDMNSCLADAELQLQSLITTEHDMEPHALRRKETLASLFEPFSYLEAVDRALISSSGHIFTRSAGNTHVDDSRNSENSIFEYIWSFPGLESSRAFFIWKVFLVDLLLDSCVQDFVSSDQNLGHDQLSDVSMDKLRKQFLEHICWYVKDRIAPVFLTTLRREIEILLKKTESIKNPAAGKKNMDLCTVRRLQLMLEEYCKVQQNIRATRTAASFMRKQIDELKEVFLKSSLEITMQEWMHNISFRPVEVSKLIAHEFLPDDDSLLEVILNTNRLKLLESMRLSISHIGRSLECLQSCESNSAAAEGQLERALIWACGDSNSTSRGNTRAKISGVPPGFRDHLTQRRKLLQEVGENATEIMRLGIAVLDFEASRDGIIRASRETGAETGAWQQSYLNAITKLDVTYNSFTHAEKEWRIAKGNMETASHALVSATYELSMALLKAKSASGELQSSLLAMRDAAHDASVALSAYGSIIRGHTALTSESGSMLEEVLAITEGFHDVHSLGKEAAILHSSLMEDLSKANAVLIPLESLLSKDVDAMTDAMSHEKQTKSEIAPIHGQAIHQSYYNRLNEALQVFKPLVPSLTLNVQGLFSVLTKLARTAGLHAGNLHKALEGVGENLHGRSHEINPLTADLAVSHDEYDAQMSGKVRNSESDIDVDSDGLNEWFLPNGGWISPPLTLSSSISTVSDGANSVDGSIQEAPNTSLDESWPASGSSHSQIKEDDPHETPSTMAQVLATSNVSPAKNGEESQKKGDAPKNAFTTTAEPIGHPQTGKNAYAVSVLRRVEMKIDGRDITDSREISVGEQVDFLLRQATDIDNLCNMYEGWTPWI